MSGICAKLEVDNRVKAVIRDYITFAPNQPQDSFSCPSGVTVDSAGNVYVADTVEQPDSSVFIATLGLN